jgi:hypothetical protein
MPKASGLFLKVIEIGFLNFFIKYPLNIYFFQPYGSAKGGKAYK